MRRVFRLLGRSGKRTRWDLFKAMLFSALLGLALEFPLILKSDHGLVLIAVALLGVPMAAFTFAYPWIEARVRRRGTRTDCEEYRGILGT